MCATKFFYEKLTLVVFNFKHNSHMATSRKDVIDVFF